MPSPHHCSLSPLACCPPAARNGSLSVPFPCACLRFLVYKCAFLEASVCCNTAQQVHIGMDSLISVPNFVGALPAASPRRSALHFLAAPWLSSPRPAPWMERGLGGMHHSQELPEGREMAHSCNRWSLRTLWAARDPGMLVYIFCSSIASIPSVSCRIGAKEGGKGTDALGF